MKSVTGPGVSRDVVERSLTIGCVTGRPLYSTCHIVGSLRTVTSLSEPVSRTFHSSEALQFNLAIRGKLKLAGRLDRILGHGL